MGSCITVFQSWRNNLIAKANSVAASSVNIYLLDLVIRIREYKGCLQSQLISASLPSSAKVTEFDLSQANAQVIHVVIPNTVKY